MIEIRHLNKYYEKGRSNEVHAIKDTNLTLPDRGIVAIFGKSGCGKTTLLNVIGGLDSAQSGEVQIDGERITPDSDYARNHNVGYIFQNYNLLPNLTVLENVAASLRLCGVTDEETIRTRTLAALASVEMEKYKNRLPDSLSGGQQQRVAIARALVKNPRLILADEPTGNLDEQNTLMVMKLLHEIAKEHLVLLVTHETNLVDLYCDLVIEVSDGAVVNQRQNQVTEGFVGKSKTDVYLGELPRYEMDGAPLSLEYYGAVGEEKPRLRLVSVGNVWYLQAPPTCKVRLLDQSAEIRVHEGVFQPQSGTDVPALDPALQAPFATQKKAGRLFGFWGAVKHSYRQNFGKSAKKGTKLFLVGLIAFAMVFVLLTAYFGHAISDYIDVTERVDSQTIYLRHTELSGNPDRLEQLIRIGQVDSVGLTGGSVYLEDEATYIYLNEPTQWRFSIGNFESIEEELMSFSASATTLHLDAAREKTLLGGKKTDLSAKEMVISSGFAKLLLENASVDYLQEPKDLLYTVGNYDSYGMQDLRFTVVGIVEEENANVYVNDTDYAFLNLRAYTGTGSFGVLDAAQAQAHQLVPLQPGQLYIRSDVISLNPELIEGIDGETVRIGGKSYTVVKYVFAEPYNLHQYLSRQKAYTAYWQERKAEVAGEFVFIPNAFEKYLEDLPVITEDVAYHVMEFLYATGEFYWMAAQPSGTDPQGFYEYMAQLENEFYLWQQQKELEYSLWYNTQGDAYRELPVVMMHAQDYVALPLDLTLFPMDEDNTVVEVETPYSEQVYLALHACDPDALLAETASMNESQRITPQDLLTQYKRDILLSMQIAGVFMAILGGLMALCLYLILRSGMMSDIREIGIYRAIGASKKNLMYRYFSESLFTFVTTVFVGYAIASGVLWWLLSKVRMMSSLLYYPAWLGLTVLGVLFAVTCFCGILPVWQLLRKTPAQILSKYDI